MCICNCHLFFHLRFLFFIFIISFLPIFIQFIYIKNCYQHSLYYSRVLIFDLLVQILDLLEEKFQTVVLSVTTHFRVCFYGPVNLKNNLIRYISTNSNFLSENTVDLLFSFLQRLRLNIWNQIIIEGKKNLFLVIIGLFFFLIEFQNGCTEVLLTITKMANIKYYLKEKQFSARKTLTKRMKPRYTVMWFFSYVQFIWLHIILLSLTHSMTFFFF